MLKERIKQIKSAKTLPEYEQLYFDLAIDLGSLNDWLADDILAIQGKKKEIITRGVKSIAEFDREFEQTAEYATSKRYKFWAEGLAKMMAGLRIKIESLKSETKGQY